MLFQPRFTLYLYYFFCTAIVLLSNQSMSAQSGMTFDEFSLKLSAYFDIELINDIQKELPQGAQYRIWSWDAGDFSGDGIPDAAFAVKILGEKRRICRVYMFTDTDGFLVKVGEYTYNFIDLPLEVGLVIRNNNCYVTEKQKQFHWIIRGYSYDNGVVSVVDEFVTQKLPSVTMEEYQNFSTLESYQKTILTRTGETKYVKKYFTIPCYPRGKQIFRGYTAMAECSTVDYCQSGSFFWQSTSDCSFSVRSVYDNEFIYFTVNVKDEEVVPGRCDTCTADMVHFWFDGQIRPSMPDTSDEKAKTPKRKKGRKTEYISPDSSLVTISIRLGDFAEKRASYAVQTPKTLDPITKELLRTVRVSANPRDKGYIVKARFPLSLFGVGALPGDLQQTLSLKGTVMVRDSDNEFRPEEETVLSTSPVELFETDSYSTLLLIPRDEWYGSATNILTEQLVKTLQEAGF